jgi:hypothetical protein
MASMATADWAYQQPNPSCRSSNTTYLSSLSVSDDKLTLSTSNGDERVDRLQTGLHWLVNGTTGKNSRGLQLSPGAANRVDGTSAIDGVSKGVNDTAEESRSDGDVDNLSGTLDRVTLLDETIVTENGDTDVVGLQVQAHASDTGRELHHLLGLDVAETVDTGDTVTNG